MRLYVPIKDHWAEQRAFTRRAIGAFLVVVAALLLVISRLVDLQVLQYEHFRELSHGNRVRIEPLPPTRGLIYDRHGVLLAENTPAFQLEITPEAVPDLTATLARLEALVEIRPQDRSRFEKALRSQRRFQAIPLRFRLGQEEVARFAVQRQHFPGVDIRPRLARFYAGFGGAVHAVGYVGGISEQDQQRLERGAYAGTTHTGKVGVERAYEHLLHGQVGYRQVLVNAQGRVLNELEKQAPTAGRDLFLTLDSRMQLAAEEALGERRGAVVAIDPRDGSLLVFASTPTYDPNPFGAGLSPAEFAALSQDDDKPLFNRALRGTYPPGSTIKPIMALAALHFEALDPAEPRMCHGFFTLPGHRHRYRDWKRRGHGPMDMRDAIVQSCDVYFYALAVNLGIERIHDFMAEFGFGERTGIDIPGEKTGLLPSPEWKQRAFSNPGDKVWFPGETVIAGIGQGYMLSTPLQLAHAAATLANRGQPYRPHLLAAVRDPVTGEIEARTPEALPAVDVAEAAAWDLVLAAMEDVVHGPRGTARRIGLDAGYRIAGKTGTAQVFSVAQDEEYDEEELEEYLRDHAWFIAFAPVEAPEVALAVMVENGGSGSREAAPVARRVLDAYFHGEPVLAARVDAAAQTVVEQMRHGTGVR